MMKDIALDANPHWYFWTKINIPLHTSEVGTTVVPLSVISCRSVFSCVGLP